MPSVYSKSCSNRSGRSGRFWNRVDLASDPAAVGYSELPVKLPDLPRRGLQGRYLGEWLQVPHVFLVGGLLAEAVEPAPLGNRHGVAGDRSWLLEGHPPPPIGIKKPPSWTAVGKRPDLNRGLLHQGHSRLCYGLPCLYYFPVRQNPVNHFLTRQPTNGPAFLWVSSRRAGSRYAYEGLSRGDPPSVFAYCACSGCRSARLFSPRCD